eukprot:5651936-Pleurochrysis_carterae.AAC.2
MKGASRKGCQDRSSVGGNAAREDASGMMQGGAREKKGRARCAVNSQGRESKASTRISSKR